jgi:hypothetical protein
MGQASDVRSRAACQCVLEHTSESGLGVISQAIGLQQPVLVAHRARLTPRDTGQTRTMSTGVRDPIGGLQPG